MEKFLALVILLAIVGAIMLIRWARKPYRYCKVLLRFFRRKAKKQLRDRKRVAGVHHFNIRFPSVKEMFGLGVVGVFIIGYIFLLFVFTLLGIWVWVIPMIFGIFTAITLLILAYLGAEKNFLWFTTVRQGTLKVIVAQGKFVRFIVNVKGWWYNPVSSKMEVARHGEDSVGWFTALTGLYVTSFLWPLRQVYWFQIHKVRMKTNSSLIKKIRDKVDVDENLTWVDFLTFIEDRAFLLLETDLGMNERVDLVGRAIYHVWDPLRLLFGLSGKFYENVDSFVRSYMLIKLGRKTFDQLRKRTFSLDPMDLRGKDHPNKSKRAEIESYDIKHLVGLEAESIVLEDMSLSESAQKVQDAKEEQVIETEKGKAAVIKANFAKTAAITGFEAEAEGIRLKGRAEAERIAVAVGAYPNDASGDAIMSVFQSEQIKELEGTYVEGGGGRQVGVMLPGGQNRPRQAPPLPTPNPPATTPPVPTPNQPPVPGQGRKKRRKSA
jgi:hypothetical protein